MATLNKYPQLLEIDHTFNYEVTSVLDELKEEYVKNIKIFAPETLLKKFDRIQNMINYFTISESYLLSRASDSENVNLSEGKVLIFILEILSFILLLL